MSVTGHIIVIPIDDTHNFVNLSWKNLWIGGHQPRLIKIFTRGYVILRYWPETVNHFHIEFNHFQAEFKSSAPNIKCTSQCDA
jgi:hypothetical protein